VADLGGRTEEGGLAPARPLARAGHGTHTVRDRERFMGDPQSEFPGTGREGSTQGATPAKRSRWLEGIHGTLRFLVGQTPVATLVVGNGEARLLKSDGRADATIVCRTEEDAEGLIRGELNPVVVTLLGRLEIEGDVALGIQVLHTLREGLFSLAPEG